MDNVVLPCHFSNQRKRGADKDLKVEAKKLLKRLHLPDELLNKPVIELSIGQQQRVAAARAIIGKPQLIIADEPNLSLGLRQSRRFH